MWSYVLYLSLRCPHTVWQLAEEKDKISLCCRELYLGHMKTTHFSLSQLTPPSSNSWLKTHFWRRRNNFTFVFEAFDDDSFLARRYHYQGLNLADKMCWGTGRKTAVRGKECPDKGGLRLGSFQEDSSGKRCGLVQLYSISRLIIRLICAVCVSAQVMADKSYYRAYRTTTFLHIIGSNS